MTCWYLEIPGFLWMNFSQSLGYHWYSSCWAAFADLHKLWTHLGFISIPRGPVVAPQLLRHAPWVATHGADCPHNIVIWVMANIGQPIIAEVVFWCICNRTWFFFLGTFWIKGGIRFSSTQAVAFWTDDAQLQWHGQVLMECPFPPSLLGRKGLPMTVNTYWWFLTITSFWWNGDFLCLGTSVGSQWNSSAWTCIIVANHSGNWSLPKVAYSHELRESDGRPLPTTHIGSTETTRVAAEDKREFDYSPFNPGRDFGPLDLSSTVTYCRWVDTLVPRLKGFAVIRVRWWCLDMLGQFSSIFYK